MFHFYLLTVKESCLFINGPINAIITISNKPIIPITANLLRFNCDTSNDISNTDFIIRDLDLNQEPEMPRQSKNFWQDAWSQLKRNKLAVIGMIAGS
jgi:hypothetical protein